MQHSEEAPPKQQSAGHHESSLKAVERAREAIRKLAVALEHSVGEMMGSASSYGDALAGHRTTIENRMPSHNDEDFGSVLLNEMATMQSANETYRSKLEEANRRVAQQKEEMESLQADALLDFLTKVPNRRSLEKKFEEEAYRAARYEQPLSLAFIDIDYFKKLNDKYGHHIGDRVLRGIAMKMKTAIRQSDFLARFGGEEFAVLLPATNVGVANTVAEKLRNSLAQSIFRTDEHEIKVTVSIGIEEYRPGEDDFEKLIARADAAMYQAKENGRNCIVRYDAVAK